VQLVRAMARRWMGDQAVIEFIPVTMETGMQMVSMGEAHLLIGAIPRTQDGELEVDYSLTTYVAGEGLMTRVGVVGGVADLDGQSVAVVEGTGSADGLRWVGRETGISVIVLSKPNLESALEALQNEEVAGVVGERIDLLWPAYGVPGVTVTADRLTWTPLALALPPGDSDFRDLVNLTLQGMARDGELASIYGNWFDDQPPELEPWPGEPAHALRIEVTATTPYTETTPGQ
jgi:ABC-type amino acid transport substrate-binding protein